MKQLIFIAAAAAVLAGCRKSEAERFGYKGADLHDDDKMFFTTGPTVTNWLPARVLSVCEEYPMSAEEDALIAAAGVVRPGEPMEKIPEGYEKLADEPWFVTWKKESEGFGKKGVDGFISHFNEDKKVWETSETYFSTYYKDEAAATAALAELKKTVGEKFAPKKFYDFDKCWVAEYLRLRVMCVVGQKPDGTWSCMLDIQDKNRSGCGQWEPVEAQAERLADYKYRKEYAAWKAAKAKKLADNHAEVEKVRAEKGLELFGEGVAPAESEDGRFVYRRFGACAPDEVKDREEFWKEKLDALAKATGVVFEGEVEKQDAPSGYTIWAIAASSGIYDVRLDMAFPPAEEKKDAEADGEKSGEESAEEAPKPQVEWRELCHEKTLPGFEVPPRPQPPRR